MNGNVTAKSLKQYLDRFVIGQEEAKKTICQVFFLHISRIICKEELQLPSFKKSNLLVTGASGQGKSYMVKLLAEYVGLPLLEIDAKSLTNQGYVGTSIQEYFSKFYQEWVSKDPISAQYSIVFIDEIDKLSPTSAGAYDSWKVDLQYSLLKYTEGCPISASSKARTDDMLFIYAGNFEAMRKKRQERNAPPKQFGFHQQAKAVEPLNTYHAELINAGVVTELAGRISIVTELQELTEQELVQILTKTENNIYDQYKKLFKFYGKTCHLSKETLLHIAKTCRETKTGARGLQSVLDNVIRDKLSKLTIDKKYFEGE